MNANESTMSNKEDKKLNFQLENIYKFPHVYVYVYYSCNKQKNEKFKKKEGDSFVK